MATNWTPGPWSHNWALDGEISGHGEFIAQIAGQNYGKWSHKSEDGEAEYRANGDLIAAAPELYEALAAIMDSTAVLNHLDAEATEWIESVMRKARGE